MHLRWVKCISVLRFLLNIIGMVAPVSSAALDYKWKCFHKIAAGIIQPGLNDQTKPLKTGVTWFLLVKLHFPFKVAEWSSSHISTLYLLFFIFWSQIVSVNAPRWGKLAGREESFSPELKSQADAAVSNGSLFFICSSAGGGDPCSVCCVYGRAWTVHSS